MTDKEIQRLQRIEREKNPITKTGKFTTLQRELSCRDMINSCLCYGTNFLNSRYKDDYIKDLGEERVIELFHEQEKDFAEATVVRGIYTDDEGLSYNRIIWADE